MNGLLRQFIYSAPIAGQPVKQVRCQAKIWIILALAFSQLAIGCNSQQETAAGTAPDTRPVLVKALTVASSDTDQPQAYSGEVRGRFETRLAFQVPGKILERRVDAGSVVNPGDTLMQIDPSDIRQAVRAGRAQLEAAGSSLNLARDQFNRFKALFDQELMSKAELDRYQNAYDSARALFKQARAQLTRAENQLEYCRLKAQGPGVILSVHADPGQVVAAGQPVIIMARGTERDIKIDLPENQASRYQPGTRFTVSFWALPGIKVNGKLRELSPVANSITRTYTARISLIDLPDSIKLGMTASALPDLDQTRDRVFVPVSALYQTADEPMVWVVENFKVKTRKVVTGAPGNDNTIQIIQGLMPGEQIVVAGVHKLHNGMTVRLGEPAP